jgi:N,N'-diacetyllegionaminate synthase
MATIKIAEHPIGDRHPCFIIAEAGVNHNGSLDLALKLVDAAVSAGADAVKFQTFTAEAVVTAAAPKANYQQQTTGTNESQLRMIKNLELTHEQFKQIKEYCDKKEIIFLSTPFDHDSVDSLDRLGVAAFKVSSAEITNYPLLKHIARKRKPTIISTGMSSLGEVEQALQAMFHSGNRKVVLLHCVSNYPANPVDVNLLAMKTMATAFGVPVGYSDHTLGIEVSLAAVALGACVIEKHVTMDRTMPGPDHQASLNPCDLAALVKGIRMIEASLGHGRKEPVISEKNTADAARRSLVAACDIPAGTVLTDRHIAIKRPGTGLPPSLLRYLIGRTSRGMIAADTILTLELFV